VNPVRRKAVRPEALQVAPHARRTLATIAALCAMALLWLGLAATVRAQSLPVKVQASGNTATIEVSSPLGEPLADLTLTFDDAAGLTQAALGVSAQLVNLGDANLLARLPDPNLTTVDASLPLLVTIEPPSDGGLAFHRSVRVEVHTHALVYETGSAYRLFKAPLGGKFRDITDEVAPGSVRARGTTEGFSEFLVLTDLRETGQVVSQKIGWLRNRIDLLPLSEQGAFDAYLDSAEGAIGRQDYSNAIAAIDMIRARAAERAGTFIQDEWRATRDVENHAGALIAGAATLKYSVAYLRDYGQ
jgi:hypothetical protein